MSRLSSYPKWYVVSIIQDNPTDRPTTHFTVNNTINTICSSTKSDSLIF